MKKLLALLLAAVMCLSLVACGGETDAPSTNEGGVTDAPSTNEGNGNSSNAEKAIIGAWNMGEYDVFVFSEDGKVARGDEEYDWWYDKETERYFLSVNGVTLSFVIEEDENGRFFDVDGERLYYLENYDPEAMEAEKIAGIVEGKTELIVGNSYTSENGVTFTLDKAEITGEETECMFNLYFTYEGSLDLGQADYESFTHWSSFGLAHQTNGSEGNTHRHAGGFEEMADLEKDREEYGFLCFTINGAEYFVSIDTFFE